MKVGRGWDSKMHKLCERLTLKRLALRHNLILGKCERRGSTEKINVFTDKGTPRM
jgi:hypothetical protein